jgi:hypothetical protein
VSDDRNWAHGRLVEAAANIQVTPAQETAAYYLLRDLADEAAKHGVQLTDLDPFIDLPTACVKVAAALDLPAA